MVVIGPGQDMPDRVTAPDGSARSVASASTDQGLGYISDVLISPSLAEQLDVEPLAAAVAFVNDRPLAARQLGAVEAFRDDWRFDEPATGYRDVSAAWPETGTSAVQLELILAGIAAVFAVLVVGATLALAAAESRDERDVLSIAGAAPRTLARSASAKAWLLAGIGAAMALPVGLLPVAVYIAADDGLMRFAVPWRAVGLVAVVLPAAAAGVAFLASATAQRLKPVRVSTAVFE
jgi:hypothetical protein